MLCILKESTRAKRHKNRPGPETWKMSVLNNKAGIRFLTYHFPLSRPVNRKRRYPRVRAKITIAQPKAQLNNVLIPRYAKTLA